MKRVSKSQLGLMALLLVFYTNAYAGDGGGKVEIEHVGNFGSYGPLVFFFTTQHTNKPACNSYKERWVLKLDTAAAREMYSLLLTAQISGKEVKIEGSGDCVVIDGSENVVWVGFQVTPRNN